MSFSSRAYSDEDDYQQIRSLLRKIGLLADGTARAPGDITVGDIDWWRFADDDPNAINTARLWLDTQGNAIGFAWPNDDLAEVVVHPHHRDIEEEMIAWVEGERSQSEPANGEPPTIGIWSFDADSERLAILQRRGYERSENYVNYRRRSLAGSLPDWPLAEGYTLRDMRGDADIAQRVEAHLSAFNPSKMTVEKHRRVMTAPTYRADLDIVAVAPDGQYAAFCIVWFDEVTRLGIFEPVGCHSDHQRKGLSSAVMSEGMRRVRNLGATTVSVIALGGDVPSNVLYESLGFHLVGEIYAWKKRLTGGIRGE